jgi:hypothetical protein
MQFRVSWVKRTRSVAWVKRTRSVAWVKQNDFNDLYDYTAHLQACGKTKEQSGN